MDQSDSLLVFSRLKVVISSSSSPSRSSSLSLSQSFMDVPIMKSSLNTLQDGFSLSLLQAANISQEKLQESVSEIKYCDVRPIFLH